MYDAIDDPYTYENSTVLVNKHDLRDARLLLWKKDESWRHGDL
jgi:hypothetical protein